MSRQLPNGSLPFLLTVLAYLLLYYGVLLAVALAADSTGLARRGDHVGNVSINFLIPLLLSMPSIASHRDGPGGGLDAGRRDHPDVRARRGGGGDRRRPVPSLPPH